MDVFENFKNQLKANPKTIVFTEGTDARILSAASKLLAGKILNVLLLGNPEAVKKAAAEGGFDITGAEICDPTSYPEFDAMVAKMVELRKGKMTEEQCRAALSKSNYFVLDTANQQRAAPVLSDPTAANRVITHLCA